MTLWVDRIAGISVTMAQKAGGSSVTNTSWWQGWGCHSSASSLESRLSSPTTSVSLTDFLVAFAQIPWTPSIPCPVSRDLQCFALAAIVSAHQYPSCASRGQALKLCCSALDNRLTPTSDHIPRPIGTADALTRSSGVDAMVVVCVCKYFFSLGLYASDARERVGNTSSWVSCSTTTNPTSQT